jgi:uncharacterized metal-binding protein
MAVATEREKQYLTDLFAGPFPGHAIIVDPEPIENPGPGDITCGGVAMGEWIDWSLRSYEAKVARHDALDDDAVPYVKASTGTQIIAAAFGCPVETPADSPAFALPLVTTADEADRLIEPTLGHPIFESVFEFARRMGYRRLGIAFCVGLSAEAERIHTVLAQHFEVYSVCCKVCALPKREYGLKTVRDDPDEVMCNPVGQAMILNGENTDLNLIVGLCMGHDIAFSKYSEAPVSTLVVKDRVLTHNPCGAIYSRYYMRRLIE